MSFLKRLWGNLTNTEEVKVRTRNKKGHYVADDPSTPDVNEAYVGGKAPKKKTTKKKVTKKRGRPKKSS